MFSIFGISFIASFIYYFMEIMNKAFFLNADLHHLFQFCMGTTMVMIQFFSMKFDFARQSYKCIIKSYCVIQAIAYSASHRVCTFWIPLKKQSLRYVPIVLWTMTMLYTQLYYIDIYNFLKKQTGFMGKLIIKSDTIRLNK